jgi:predicted RNA binding protein YcfA (HicA-like mRNA interferase family)
MTRLPIVNFTTMDKLLIYLGFKAVRQRGSHVFYRHPDGRVTTAPNHPGRDIARPLTRKILREINLSPEQYRKILESL